MQRRGRKGRGEKGEEEKGELFRNFYSMEEATDATSNLSHIDFCPLEEPDQVPISGRSWWLSGLIPSSFVSGNFHA